MIWGGKAFVRDTLSLPWQLVQVDQFERYSHLVASPQLPKGMMYR
jgi:hypothetical protein